MVNESALNAAQERWFPAAAKSDEGSSALSRSRPKILLAASKWWPLSARLAGALHRHGCDVSAICPLQHSLMHVTGMGRTYRYGSIASLSSLQRAVRESEAELVIPCDDSVVVQLHALHAIDPSLRPLIERSLGSPDSFDVVGNRYRLLSLAAELGVRVPRTRRVSHADDLVDWHDNVSPIAVVKVDGDSGGNGVRISRSLSDSQAAFERFRQPASLAAALKRTAVDCDPLALWMRRHRTSREVSVQEFISGRPANSMCFCWQGQLVAIVSVVVVAAEGPTGAATIVRPIRNERMKNAAEVLASKLKLSGFFGLDFVLESTTGVPYLIEMNPRCTQLGHIDLPGMGSLAGALAAVLKGEPPPASKSTMRSDTIALFPQALCAGEACRAYFEAAYHDVPTDDPPLMRELMQKSWPHRQWKWRLYHHLNPMNRAEPAMFESLEAKAQTVA